MWLRGIISMILPRAWRGAGYVDKYRSSLFQKSNDAIREFMQVELAGPSIRTSCYG